MKEIIKQCPKCSKDYNAYSKWGEKKFCSRKCANSRSWNNDDREKKSKSFWTSDKTLKPKTYFNTCLCGKKFEVLKPSQKKKYCSHNCRLMYGKKTPGGYRPGSGRAKSGYYNGIYCGSTYELCWVIYNLDHSIKFERFEGIIESESLKYIPDFLIGNRIIEIKGYGDKDKILAKKELAESHGYTVDILYGKDLQYCFEYVKKQYGTDRFYELYDNYKPKYQYVCSNCNSKFETDKKRNTDVVFCSRLCSGKGHKGRVKSL
jgi:DNA-directed RNA polymerase subunit RPC12/RpoP